MDIRRFILAVILTLMLTWARLGDTAQAWAHRP
jgi:hypothetical protein